MKVRSPSADWGVVFQIYQETLRNLSIIQFSKKEARSGLISQTPQLLTPPYHKMGGVEADKPSAIPRGEEGNSARLKHKPMRLLLLSLSPQFSFLQSVGVKAGLQELIIFFCSFFKLLILYWGTAI